MVDIGTGGIIGKACMGATGGLTPIHPTQINNDNNIDDSLILPFELIKRSNQCDGSINQPSKTIPEYW
jgi:hypothetical protein